MSRRGFCSPFAEDFDNMIDLMVVSGGAESSYLPRARSFDNFCAHEHPECSELTEWLILEWLRPVMKKEPAVIHQRICFMNGFARYLNNVGETGIHDAQQVRLRPDIIRSLYLLGR